MKRRIIAMLMIMVIFSLSDVEATLLSSRLPGGKNYLDINNVDIVNNSLSTIDSIYVKNNTNYTLSLPKPEMIGDTFIAVYGDEDYLYGDVGLLNECVETDVVVYCTFYTTSTYLDIEITGTMLDIYYSYYGIDYFMLEEGELPTEYEPYIVPLEDTTSPEFNQTGAYIMSYQDTILIEDIIQNHVVAIDEVDGDLSNQIEIVSDQYSGNKGVVGSYDVLLEVSDSSNNKAQFTLVVMIKDEVPPIITPNEVIVEVGTQDSIQDLISSQVQCVDEYDGVLPCTVVNDGFSANRNIVGDYNVLIQTIDSSVNETNTNILFRVVDTIQPRLESDPSISIAVEDEVFLVDILNDLVVSDNYSIPVVTVLQSNYDGSVPGVYFVDIRVTDEGLNSTDYTLTITVTDNTPPVIGGPNQVEYSYTQNLTIDHILSLMTVSDNVSLLSKDDLVIVFDTYSNRMNPTGVFEVTFSAVDEAGLETLHTVTITIIDDQSPVIFVDDYIVQINPNVTFSTEDALSLLLRNHELEEGKYMMKTLIDEYSGNEDIPGMYVYQVEFTSEEGDVYVKDFVVHVVGEEEVNYQRVIVSGIVVFMVIGVVVIKKIK